MQGLGEDVTGSGVVPGPEAAAAYQAFVDSGRSFSAAPIVLPALQQITWASQAGFRQTPTLSIESYQLFQTEDAIKKKQYIVMGIVGALLVTTAGVVIYKRRKAMRSAG
jgi:LPXTG-motif cell wall-anchored protein